MGKKKLTLSIEATVVERAKRFSRRNETSLSELVTAFLATLEDDHSTSSPIVSRLRGVLPSSASREDYRQYLEEKHR